MTALFLFLEFRTSPQDSLLREDGQLATGETPRVMRILLRRLGGPPWDLRSRNPLPFVSSSGAKVQGRHLQLTLRDDVVLVDGKPFSRRLDMTEAARFTLNGHALSGRLRVDASGPGRPVLLVDLEEYLAQVLPGEMPLSYPMAALEAQVVAARSYAVATALRRRSRAFDMTDGEASQMFDAINSRTEKAARIVARSRGLVLAYEGRILPAYFSANCGGQTRSNHEAFGEEPWIPLGGVLCPHCSWSPDFTWIARLDSPGLLEDLNLDGPALRVVVQKGRGSGYTNVLSLQTPAGRRRVNGRRLRRLFGHRRIKSTWLVGAEMAGSSIILSGRGFGHGVGLCQNGARGLARRGHSAQEILNFYYPKATLLRMAKTDSE